MANGRKSNLENIKENISLKFRFYIMSLWLLFLLIFFLTINVEGVFNAKGIYVGTLEILKRNCLALSSLALCFLGMFFAFQINYEWKGVFNPPYKISIIKNENYEYLTFLTTYILPLICIDLEKVRYVIVLAILLVIIGFIFIRMDLYYGNPTLALMGYRIYRAEIQGFDMPEGVVIISKDKLYSNSFIKWIPISQNVWVAKVVHVNDR